MIKVANNKLTRASAHRSMVILFLTTGYLGQLVYASTNPVVLKLMNEKNLQ